MKRFLLLCFSMQVAVLAMAATLVKGTVTDKETSEPLIGVSIQVKGMTTGTVTDFDGTYALEVPDKAVLAFSYVGYKTVELTAQTALDVAMETDAFELQEVVSLGYSAVKKAELSSAVVSMSGEKLTDVTTPDVGNMLQGKVAGVQVSNASGQPGDAAEIRIRGTGSITAGSDPVYVVDGVMGGTFNPNDVKTISVLKDAGSTGIYGANASGGVIVVTTKQGKKNDKVHVDLKGTVGGKMALYGNMKMMTGKELYYYQRQIYNDDDYFLLERPTYLRDRNYDWIGEFFKTGILQNYNVAVHGGSEHVGYYASLDYYDEQGTFKGTGMKRVSGHASIKADICKWLDMNVKVDFNKSTVDYAPTWEMLDDAFNKMPWDNPYAYDAYGNQTTEYVNITKGLRPDNKDVWYSHIKSNSLYTSEFNSVQSNNFDFNGVLQLGVHFTDWLHFTTTNQFATGYYKSTTYCDPRVPNDYNSAGYQEESLGLNKSFGTTNILKGGYQWGQHSFNAMLGYEYSYWKSEYTTSAGIGMPAGVKSLNSTTPYSVGGYEVPGAGWAAFVQASYDYHKRYFLTGTFRAESSSIFAPKNRTGYFPSVAASWLITNEKWMQQQKVVSFMKLRASYGVTGNNNINPYQYLGTYSLNSLYQNTVAATPSRLANADLQWERANMASVGLDLAFINRIDMSLDLYQTDNTGLLMDVNLSPATGFYKITQNAGSVCNRGIEFRIDANVLKLKKWRWDIGFNIGFNKNVVTKTPNGDFTQTRNNVQQIVREGNDIYSWYMKEWAGVDPTNGDPLWYVVDANENYVLDANGNKTTTNDINATHAKICGKATPLFSGGLNTMLSWNGIYLQVNMTFQYGNKIFNYTRITSDCDGQSLDYNQLSLENSKLGWTRWQQPGDNATHPKVQAGGNHDANSVSSRYLEDGSYFRIRNLTLGYDFPEKWIKKAHMTKLRVYFTTDNLCTASKFSGMDPEISLTTTQYNLAGMYTATYPVGRTFQGGVEISF